MQVSILTPEKNVFKGEADSVTFPGIDGKFQVLKDHAALISSLGNGEVVVKSGADEQVFTINSGFVEVLNNNISVLVEGTI